MCINEINDVKNTVRNGEGCIQTNRQTNKQTKQHTQFQVSKQVFDEYSLMYLWLNPVIKGAKAQKLILKYDLGKSLSKEM